jgi:hypothetical protein
MCLTAFLHEFLLNKRNINFSPIRFSFLFWMTCYMDHLKLTTFYYYFYFKHKNNILKKYYIALWSPSFTSFYLTCNVCKYVSMFVRVKSYNSILKQILS